MVFYSRAAPMQAALKFNVKCRSPPYSSAACLSQYKINTAKAACTLISQVQTAFNAQGLWPFKGFCFAHISACSVGQLPLQKPIAERPIHAVEQVFGNQPKFGIAFNLQFAVEKQSIRVFLAHHHAHEVDAVGGKA